MKLWDLREEEIEGKIVILWTHLICECLVEQVDVNLYFGRVYAKTHVHRETKRERRKQSLKLWELRERKRYMTFRNRITK